MAAAVSILGTSAPTEVGVDQAQQDSQSTLKNLRAAQARFERTRRARLPFNFRPSSNSRCDLYVGRFCYWHDESDWWAPDDHPEVVQERLELLSQLDSALALYPGDGWLNGQQIRYFIEVGWVSEALKTTRECRAEMWWCSALEGYVQHTKGDFAAADSVFELALDAMTEDRECEWRDLSLLLSGDARGEYKNRSCSERRQMENRFWWLTDPLYLVAGNERRTEHYSRLVVNELMLESASPRSNAWGRDNRELLVRFGPIIGWERRSASRTSFGSRSTVVGHHRNESWHFVPLSDYLTDPSRIEFGEWDLEPDNPHERYGASYAVEFAELTHNLYVFRDGDSALVVATCVPPTTGEAGQASGKMDGAIESGLVIVSSEYAEAVAVTDHDCRTVIARVPIEPTLVSVEAISHCDSLAARSRYWVDIPERLSGGANESISMSDIMLLDVSGAVPGRLDEAAPLARPSSATVAGEEIGLYWEVYGLDNDSSSVQFSLSVDKVGKSFLRKAAEWSGLVGPSHDMIQMKWTEPILDVDSVKRGITLKLNEDMNGDYVIRLSARLASGARATASKAIIIER